MTSTKKLTLLQQRDLARYRHRLELYEAQRRRLRQALAELVPGRRVIVFGSLTKPGVFNDRSDIDVALEKESLRMDTWRLMSELMDRLGRRVDVVVLNKCRFRERILREGEVWTV